MEIIDREFIIIPDIFNNFHILYDKLQKQNDKYKLQKQIKDLIYYKKFNNIYLKFLNKNMLNNLVNIKMSNIISKDYLKYYNTIIIKKNKINLMNELSKTIKTENIEKFNNKKQNTNNIRPPNISNNKLTYKKRKYEGDNNILLENDSVKKKNNTSHITICINNEYQENDKEEYINELFDNYIISCCTCCSYISKIVNHYCNKFNRFLKDIFS